MEAEECVLAAVSVVRRTRTRAGSDSSLASGAPLCPCPIAGAFRGRCTECCCWDAVRHNPGYFEWDSLSSRKGKGRNGI